MLQQFVPDGPFATERGAAVPALRVGYRTWGALNAAADNAVVVCHALTGNPDAADWWGGLVGPGRLVDPARHFVVCPAALGSCVGTTGPGTPDAAGRRLGSRFPAVSIRDMARLHAALLEHLGVRRVALALGGSMGGMQALELALVAALGEAAAPPVERLALVGMGAAHGAWAIATGEAQRLAVRADPRWRGGDFPADDPPADGLAAARAQAMLTYRTPAALEARLGRARQADGPHAGAFAAESYLRHHGAKLVARFDAGAYVALTEAMDTHDVDRDRPADALARLAAPALCVGISSDLLYPPAEARALAARLPGGRYAELHSDLGHDAFLADPDGLDALLRPFLTSTGFVAPRRTPDLALP